MNLKHLLNAALFVSAGNPSLTEEQRAIVIQGAMLGIKSGKYENAADILYAQKNAGLLYAFGQRLIERGQFEGAFALLRFVEAKELMPLIAEGALREQNFSVVGAAQMYGDLSREHLELIDCLDDEKNHQLMMGATDAAYRRWLTPPMPVPPSLSPEEQKLVDTCLPRLA